MPRERPSACRSRLRSRSAVTLPKGRDDAARAEAQPAGGTPVGQTVAIESFVAELEAFRKDPTPLLEMRSDIEGRMNRGMTFALKDLLELSEKYGLAALSVVNDPEVRAKLTPDHPFGCKRPLLSNDYFKAFNEPNLELVTEPIART